METYGLRRAFDFNEAHTTVASDRESLVVAEARNLNASLLASLVDRVRTVDLNT